MWLLNPTHTWTNVFLKAKIRPFNPLMLTQLYCFVIVRKSYLLFFWTHILSPCRLLLLQLVISYISSNASWKAPEKRCELAVLCLRWRNFNSEPVLWLLDSSLFPDRVGVEAGLSISSSRIDFAVKISPFLTVDSVIRTTTPTPDVTADVSDDWNCCKLKF